jgi:2-polyprenyl-3-methyl-5-hydroxy-6-metoxy-1,4-benzoquinol methylase
MTASVAYGRHAASGHLDYYVQHALNPVRYDMSSRTWHFQRRASLYRSLGIHPMTVRNARVLEVAAGSGQNSLYLASLRPRHFTLVEPNPVAIRDIRALYAEPSFAAWRPELFEGKFEDFHPVQPYDLVVCENWLGQGAQERALLRKLSTLVSSGGLLVVTCVSPVGFLPNVLRRLLSVRLGCWERTFEEATRLLEETFDTHLVTLAAMTRRRIDWIQDNLLNPHYFNICLNVSMVLDDLADTMSVVGSSPDFAVDWRWFKALYGSARDFNGHFRAEYLCNAHNFLDHRRVLPRGDLAHNLTLESAATALIETAARVDTNARSGLSSTRADQDRICAHLSEVLAILERYGTDHVQPLREFEHIYHLAQLAPAQVRAMTAFAGLFGRETIYLSLEKHGPE